jgi:hypothetical protein
VRRISAAVVGTVMALALFPALGSAQIGPPDCDEVDVCPDPGPVITTTAHVRVPFAALTIDSVHRGGIVTATAGGAFIPPQPIVPPSPSERIAQGVLYSPDPDYPPDPVAPPDPMKPLAIGTFYPPQPIRPHYLFEGRLVPGGDRTVAWPPDPMMFVGRYFPPDPV